MRKTYKYAAAVMLSLSMAAGLLTGCGGKAPEPTTAAGGGREIDTVQESTADSNETETESASETNVSGGSIASVGVIIDHVSDSAADYNTYRQKANLKYDMYRLTDEDAKKYPKLAAAWDERNEKSAKENEAQLEELISMSDELYTDMSANGNESVDSICEMSHEAVGRVLRADSNIVSIQGHFYSYYGGVHPYYSYYGHNYDVETGKELKITDVVNDMDKLFELIDAQLLERYPEEYEYFVKMDDYKAERDYVDNMSFVLGNEGLRIFFNPYEIGSYAMGAQVIDIFFDEHPELFEAKYMETLEDYVIPIDEEMSLYLDVKGDGREEVNLAVDYQEYYNNWIITAGRRSVKIDDSCYDQDSYVICKNGKYYLYIYETSDNDYMMLRVVDLEKMDYDPDYCESLYLTDLDHEWSDERESEGIYRNKSSVAGFMNLDDFAMGTRLFLLGTHDGVRHYKVGDDGKPVPTEDAYKISFSGVIKSNMEIPCELVDYQNGTSTDAVIPADTFLIYAATDGESWVDLQEVDASLVQSNGDPEFTFYYMDEAISADRSKPVYRIHPEHREYYYVVNGVEDLEAFTGIVYAG